MVERLTRNPRIFIGFAVVLALIAAVLVYLLLHNATKLQGTVGPGGVSLTPVAVPTVVTYSRVVAIQDVPMYTVINTSPVVTTYFTETTALTKPPADAFSTLQDFLAYVSTGSGGRYTSGPLVANELVRKGVLADMHGRVAFSLSLNMPSQRVAESVSVPSLQSVNAGVQQGDQVDVLLTEPMDELYNFLPPGRQKSPLETQTLIQNVPVLAAVPPVYTLMVSHQDAVLLKFVKDTNAGSIELALRSWLDPNAKDFKTTAVVPQYLTSKLVGPHGISSTNFITITAPLLPTAVPVVPR